MPYSIAALTLAAVILLSGCGQMGPLYEPVESTPPPATASGPAPAETS